MLHFGVDIYLVNDIFHMNNILQALSYWILVHTAAVYNMKVVHGVYWNQTKPFPLMCLDQSLKYRLHLKIVYKHSLHPDMMD